MYECDSEVQWQLRHNKSTTVTQEYSGNRGTTAQRHNGSTTVTQEYSGNRGSTVGTQRYCREAIWKGGHMSGKDYTDWWYGVHMYPGCGII
jgi:hypothetical protein